MVRPLYYHLAQPLARVCQRRLIWAQKQRQTLKALTAGDYQITTVLEAGLLSLLLDRDLSAAALCHQKYLWKFQTEVGWPLVRNPERRIPASRGIWNQMIPLAPFSSWIPGLSFGLIWSRQPRYSVSHIHCILLKPLLSFLHWPSYALPCPTSRTELLLSFWDYSWWFWSGETKNWSL